MDNNYINQLECKLRSLENKAEIYQKQISILEDKLKVYEKDSSLKAGKINEQLKQITRLEKENASLKKALNDIKFQNNREKNALLNTVTSQKDDYNQELLNLKKIIDGLNQQNKDLSEELAQKKSQNELYNQDNTILLSKVQEMEENNHNLISDSEKMNKDFNNYQKMLEEDFNAQLSQYTDMINNELTIISQYIDTYIGVNIKGMSVPNIWNMTNLPDNHCLMFDMLRNSVEGSRKRTFNQLVNSDNNLQEMKKEIYNYNKLLEMKINELTELKNVNSELKENMFIIQDQHEKLVSELAEMKILNRKLQGSVGEIEGNCNKYIEWVYLIIKNELENMLHDKVLQNYNIIILENEDNDIEGIAGVNNSRFKFEDSLDKFITITHALINDIKTLKDKNYMDYSRGNINSLDINEVNELNSKIGKLKEEVINYEKELSLAKEERKLLISQIELMEDSNKKNETNI